MPETSHLQTDSALHAWVRREAAKIPPLTAEEARLAILLRRRIEARTAT